MSIKSALCFVLIFILLLSVFSLSALAVTDQDVFSVPVTQGNLSSLQSSGFAFGTNGSITYYCGAQSEGCYGALFYYTYNGRRYIYVAFLSETRLTAYYVNSSGTFSQATLSSQIIDDTEYYSGTASLYPENMTTSYPVYANFNEAVSAIAEYISTPTPDPISSLSYTLPPGNVAYIPIPSGQTESITYTLTTTYYMAFGNNDTSRINQVVTVMSSLPSSSNNLAPSSPKIPWTNNGNLNLLGISANKIYQGSIPSNYGGQYLVVVNPMTMPSEGGLIGGDTYTNGSINISVSAVSGSPHIYPMSESLTITPGDGIGSESSYGDSGYTYDVDPETGEIIWTDPDGGNEAPVAGGNNPMPTPNTIFDWLRNISQQFSDFLRGPVQAVQVVVSAIRDFMGSFTQLYQWLPSPVYSLITSALMIAITIGVIKIFV